MNIENIDFNDLYKEQKEQSSFQAKSQEAWDKKASSMNQRIYKSIYNEEFLNCIDLDGINTAFDMGCGVGNISLKLAENLDEVYCVDYSKNMLDFLNQNAKNEQLSNIKTYESSWENSWDDLPKADLIIASRSMEVKDMKKALLKLNNQANKKVVISYKKGGSFVSDEILEVLQRDIVKKPDYIYILNILYSLGIFASVNFIKSEAKTIQYESKEKFVESISWSLDGLSEEERLRLEKYYDTIEVKVNEDFVYWAVISWDK